MFDRLRLIWHPEWYHNPRKGPYFEGWYYKNVDKHGKHSFIVIPGVFIEKDSKKSYAFIQIFRKDQTPHFIQYPIEEFSITYHPFAVNISRNHFTLDSLSLTITTDALAINGEVRYHNCAPQPITLFSPGAMGWYAFVPTMECNHAVLSMDHAISGTISYNGKLMDFTDGRGYMELKTTCQLP